ncbi:MAG: sn-glycerol-3-phosphate ABC transporter ATP-binding protein UgpC [Actinomycetota bacterium]|nr:sn-glycerol-3-phosphate ABC transporter ATP-binding protein UgpC [Actinomycetota bacterium]
MSGIVLEGVTKEFPGGIIAVREVSFEVQPGEFMVLVGPSGCGKTTTLRMVAGLEEVSGGEVRIDDRVVTGLPPRHRDIAMVFQNYALYAHMTVRDNIGFGLRMHGMAKREMRRRVDEAAEILGIVDLLARKPRQLSGGQRQRVAMGRAIVREPAAFLMDEPLSNLDAKLRVEMRAEITNVQRRIGAPTLYVTHDQTEAMTMGDRVAVLKDGVLQQLGSPSELYDHPANIFIAGFIGSPAMNLVATQLENSDGRHVVSFGKSQIVLPPALLEGRQGLAAYAGREIILGVRPEDISDGANSAQSAGIVGVVVARTESLGSELVVYFEPESSGAARSGAPASVDVLGNPKATPLTARLPRGASMAEGSIGRLAVDLDHLYFFDRASGAAIT